MTSSSSTGSNLSNLSGKPPAAVGAVNYSITCSDYQFRLFCWILGGSNSFSVKIGKSETVDDLKAAIRKKKEPELDYLAADALSVWKVGKSSRRVSIGDLMFRKLSPPIPSAKIDAKLGHVKCPGEISGCVELDAFKEISQVFESPPPKHLHIVLRVPPTREYPRRLYIACLLPHTTYH